MGEADELQEQIEDRLRDLAEVIGAEETVSYVIRLGERMLEELGPTA